MEIPPPANTPVHLQQPEGHSTKPEIIEVKCPYTDRELTVQEAAKQNSQFCLGELEFKIITSLANEAMFLVALVCLFVCLWTTLLKKL